MLKQPLVLYVLPLFYCLELPFNLEEYSLNSGLRSFTDAYNKKFMRKKERKER